MPDDISTRFADLQLGAGVPDVDTLIAQRDRLIHDHARLFALFEDSGKQHDALRKVKLSVAALKVREQLEGQKVTEALVDQMAHADPEYKAFVEDGFADRCRYAVVENDLRDINDRINRGGAILKRYNP